MRPPIGPTLLSLALVSSGCGGAGESPDLTQDGGGARAADGGAGPTVEVGTGLDRFESIVEGQALPLDVGPQGGGRFEGYHIYSAVRVEGFVPNDLLATFTIEDEAGVVHATQARSFRALQPDGDAFVAYAIAPRLMDCCAVEGAPVVLRVEVRDASGQSGSDARRVMAGACEDPDAMGASLCP